MGVHRQPHLIFTLFQSNIYKVDVREFLPGIYVVKTKQTQPLNEDVFEVSALRFFIVSFKRF